MKEINNGELRLKNVGQVVELYGFVANKRNMGIITFVDLRDRTGVVQIVLDKNDSHFNKESVIKVIGEVRKRKNINSQLSTGEIEVIVKSIIVLSLSKEELPFVIRDDLEAKEDTKLKHRYLDLRRPKMYQNLLIRHKVIKSVRDFLDDSGFLEIETPYLAKSTPEGARDFLAPTRFNNNFFALPQSPQLYKQLLMSAGFEKYFQIVRCFRDEDSRKDRQPEFTQLDIEMSFVNEKDIKILVESLIKSIWEKLNLDTNINFRNMNYVEAIDKYGTDKPDLRYDLLLENGKSIFNNSDFKVFNQAKELKMIISEDIFSNKQIKFLEQVAIKNGAKGLFWSSFNKENNLEKGPGFKFVKQELEKIIEDKKLIKGTILMVAGDYHVVTKALGAVRVEMASMLNLVDHNKRSFVWIENWPMFELDEDINKLSAMHHPFTAPSENNVGDFDTNPLSAKAKAYDLVLNGFEIGGGSIRINDLNIQKRMFKTLGLKEDEFQNQFGFFLEAFKYGLPPHGGIAFGIDRIIMILQNANSIRDVIAFPKNANGQAVMETAPSKVSKEQLDEYNLKIK